MMLDQIPKKALWYSQLALVLSFPLSAETVEQTAQMEIQDDQETTMGMRLPFPATAGDETTRTYSGEFPTSIKFNRETLEVEGFKFNDGEILISPYRLQFQDFITYPAPNGTKSTVVIQEPFVYEGLPRGTIRFSPETVRENDEGEIEFGEVDSEGKLRNLDHRLYADRGAYLTKHVIVGVNQDVRIESYIPGATLLYKGTSTVEISETDRSVHEISLRAYLTIELDERVLSTLQGNTPGLDIQIVETEEGTIIANTDDFEIPTAYGEWAIENDLDKPDPDEVNDSGIAYGLLFALDLPVDSTSLPISVEHTPGGPVTVKILLPESGLNNPLSVDYTTDLSNTDWPALPDIYYLDGSDSLDLGMTGEASFGFPPGRIGFVRFVTVLE